MNYLKYITYITKTTKSNFETLNAFVESLETLTCNTAISKNNCKNLTEIACQKINLYLFFRL